MSKSAAALFEQQRTTAINWFNRSSDLRGAAAALWACRDRRRGAEVVTEFDLGAGFDLAIATRPVFLMLCGMSLELIYKAAAVAQGKDPLHHHKLRELAGVAVVPIAARDRPLLDILTSSIEWAGRYPVPTDQKRDDLARYHSLIDEHLWDRAPFGDDAFTLVPNRALEWDGFDKLWMRGSAVYWKYARLAEPRARS